MNRALVVIDVQESFRVRPSWRVVGDPEIGKAVQRLVDAARAAGDLVVWVLHAEPGSGNPFDPASGHVRLFDGLDRRPDEPLVTKTSRNAFTTTNLQQVLTTHRVRELTLCGIQTEQCVETTARVGGDLGYDVTFVTDATTTFPIAHRDAPADLTPEQLVADPRTLPVDAVVSRTEYALAGRFATIRTVAELTGS
ncbi:cysteine hydrolase family protein [Actinoplanes sp. NPDC051494]|uniref:cysteine hydrolase family protein n=1 Tax=Actinoplanes sp. NPDC051494 TaxID=3363907 RepID=UPI0037926F07